MDATKAWRLRIAWAILPKAMSQGNVEVVRRFIEAFNAHDVDRWLDALAPDFEFVDHMGAVGEEAGSGRQAIRRQAEGWFEAFPDFRVDADELIDAGDRVVCVSQWRGTGAVSGLDYHQAAAEVHTVQDSKIVRSELGFADKAAAFKAAGLEE